MGQALTDRRTMRGMGTGPVVGINGLQGHEVGRPRLCRAAAARHVWGEERYRVPSVRNRRASRQALPARHCRLWSAFDWTFFPVCPSRVKRYRTPRLPEGD